MVINYTDYLTPDSVSILYDDRRQAYVNSARGREWLAADVDADTLAAILEVWGDAPTVSEDVPDLPPPVDPGPSLQERVEGLDQRVSTTEQEVAAISAAITEGLQS